MRMTFQNMLLFTAGIMIFGGFMQRMVQPAGHSTIKDLPAQNTRALQQDANNRQPVFTPPPNKSDIQNEDNHESEVEAEPVPPAPPSLAQTHDSRNPSPSFGGQNIKLLHTSASGSYSAPVSINGADMVMLVDTGASYVALTQEDARAIGIWPTAPEYNVPVSTANGQVMAAHGMIPVITIDNIRVGDVDCLVLPQEALQQSLLGMSFLNRLSSFSFENGDLELRQ